LLFEGADGSYAIWTLHDTAIIGVGLIANPGPGWFFKGAGDFNGGGKADLLFEDFSGSYALESLSRTSRRPAAPRWRRRCRGG
jgi:hypothetical protein